MIAQVTATDWTVGDVISLGVGGLGLLLAILSLLTQRRHFRLSGSRVEVELRVGVVTDPSSTPPTIKQIAADDDWRAFLRRSKNRSTAVLMLVATNMGRMGIGMEGADVVLRFNHVQGLNTLRLQAASSLNPTPGQTLAPHHRATWYADLNDLWDHTAPWFGKFEIEVKPADIITPLRTRLSDRAWVWMELRLGDATSVRSPQSITIKAEEIDSDSQVDITAAIARFHASVARFNEHLAGAESGVAASAEE